jgi:hypothetical protein
MTPSRYSSRSGCSFRSTQVANSFTKTVYEENGLTNTDFANPCLRTGYKIARFLSPLEFSLVYNEQGDVEGMLANTFKRRIDAAR